MSEGKRSGVNWILEKSALMEKANAFANLVLPVPGTSSIRTCPSAKRATRISFTVSSFPTITFPMFSLSLLITSVLLIILGLVTITKTGILLWVVGIIIMIYSAIEIVGYIFYSKDNTNYEEEEGETRLLIPEDKDDKDDKEDKKTKKNKKIKDVEDQDIEEK